MSLIRMKPSTNGQRHKIGIEKKSLSKSNRIIKKLSKGYKRHHGRSTLNGRITIWHKGAGKKRLIRKVDEKRTNKKALVISNCYDPVRTSFISLNFEIEKKFFFYSLASEYIYPGSLLKKNINKGGLKLGFTNRVCDIPAGSIIHNVWLNSKIRSSIAKAAGTFSQIIQVGDRFTKIRMPSKKIIEIPTSSSATLGITSNVLNNKLVLGKAGVKRNKGIRPTVRGVAMNPVDHPHGGRTNGGRPSVTPWGIPTKGKFKLKK